MKNSLGKSTDSIEKSNSQVETQEDISPRYPTKIPESQGDLADRANIEIDQELLEEIKSARGEPQNTAAKKTSL